MQGRRASAGEFGRAVIAEVVTPALVRRQAQAALDVLVQRYEAWPDQLPTPAAPTVSSVRSVGDDDAERRLEVVVDLRLEARLGNRRVGAGSMLRVAATVRVRAYRPAVLRLMIDPLTSADLAWRRSTSTGPGALAAGLTSSLMDLAEIGESMIPVLTTALNAALDSTTRQRDVDVPDLIRRALSGSRADAARPSVGDRVDFAEFGVEALRLGVDAEVVRHVLDARLAGGPPIPVRRPPVVYGSATPRLADVRSLPSDTGEPRFAVTLDIELDVRVGGGRGPRVRRTVSADTVLRVAPHVQPASLLVGFDRFAPEDVRLPPPGRSSRVRRLTVRALPGLIARRLNEQLPEPQCYVAAELAGSAAGPGSAAEIGSQARSGGDPRNRRGTGA